MKIKTFLVLIVAWLCGMATLSAQTMAPKREFRGAWIQCVNGQFQGMPTEKMKATLISQLDNLK